MIPDYRTPEWRRKIEENFRLPDWERADEVMQWAYDKGVGNGHHAERIMRVPFIDTNSVTYHFTFGGEGIS